MSSIDLENLECIDFELWLTCRYGVQGEGGQVTVGGDMKDEDNQTDKTYGVYLT